MAKPLRKRGRPDVTAGVLQKVAKAMLPFYTKIATNRSFAEQWSIAVITADLDRMGKLFASIPTLSGNRDYGTNAIGYFVSFPYPLAVAYYTNGTTIPPGAVQFTFDTKAHRFVARAVLPFYRKLATSCSFARAFARAIRRKDKKAIACMVRGLVTTGALRSVTIEDGGAALLFKPPFSKYPYRNLLFRETY